MFIAFLFDTSVNMLVLCPREAYILAGETDYVQEEEWVTWGVSKKENVEQRMVTGALGAAGINGWSGVSPEKVRSEQRLDRREGILQAGCWWVSVFRSDS